jgi:hypothetical protein
LRALGAAMNWNSGGRHPTSPLADVRHGLLTPETEDLAALTTSGAHPTVLAFALLTRALVATIPHDPTWSTRLTGLLA